MLHATRIRVHDQLIEVEVALTKYEVALRVTERCLEIEETYTLQFQTLLLADSCDDAFCEIDRRRSDTSVRDLAEHASLSTIHSESEFRRAVARRESRDVDGFQGVILPVVATAGIFQQ